MPASTLTAANPASVTPSGTTFLAGYLGHDGGPGRIFTTAANIGAGGLSNTCPAVTALAQVTAVDGAFPSLGGTPGGPWVMKLTPAVTDTVNASSPMSRIYLSPNALLVTTSG